jgi:HK97 gp10 family phage protein
MRISAQIAGMDAVALKAKRRIEAARFGLKAGVSEGAFMLQEEAKTLVPVDTGHLRDSIHTETVVDGSEVQELAVTAAVEASNPWGIDPAYARRIELGFVGADSLGREYHNPPQPFMRPAFDAKRDEVKQTIKESVFEAVAGVR